MIQRVLWVACFIVGCLVTSVAEAQQCGNKSVCVPQVDLEKFVALARERKCLDESEPEFTLDTISVLTDVDGRVFYTGADAKKPFKVTMKWCHLTVVGDGEVELIAARQTPATSGFRFRPKAYLGYLPLKLSDRDFDEGIDAGMLIDVAFVEWVNLNLAAGFRSVGAGLGFDITQNFGAYTGYALGWTAPHQNVNVGVYFAF
jgi:hypothetical protein